MLCRTYVSLLNQYCSVVKFEWILVDDFSNDDDQTVSLINELCVLAPFPTKKLFLDKNYCGVKSAFLGANIAEGEYVLILDQDDMITKNALIVFKDIVGRYRSEQSIAGACGRCIDMKGRFIGTRIKQNEIISNELEMRHIHKIRGEMWQCTKREIIQEYFSDLKPGYAHGHAWTRIARKYRYIYTNSIVRQYDTDNPLSTSNAKKIVCVNARVDMLRYQLVYNHDYLRHDWLTLIKRVAQYIRLSSRIGVNANLAISVLPAEQRYLGFAVAPLAILIAAIEGCFRRSRV